MGTLNNGPFGHMRGKLGNLVFYTVNGKNVSRSVGARTAPPTPAELRNRKAMKVIGEFLGLVGPFIKIGFAGVGKADRKSAYNAAVSYNRKHALTSELNLDYSNVLLSSGQLPPPHAPALSILPNGVAFTWGLQPDLEYRHLSNQAMILLYFPAGTDASNRPCAIWQLNGARRSESADFVTLDPEYIGKPFEAFISFSGFGNDVSDSVWTR